MKTGIGQVKYRNYSPFTLFDESSSCFFDNNVILTDRYFFLIRDVEQGRSHTVFFFFFAVVLHLNFSLFCFLEAYSLFILSPSLGYVNNISDNVKDILLIIHAQEIPTHSAAPYASCKYKPVHV